MDGLGISCFTLYTQDLWQPTRFIPHEVDTNLYYPEPMYAGPPLEFPEEVGKCLTRKLRQLRCGFFPNTVDAPSSSSSFDSSHHKTLAPLYDRFTDREQICSTAIFRPGKPSIRGNDLPEVLYFDFRRPQTFPPRQRTLLADLADRIFCELDDDVQVRKNVDWFTAMFRSVRCHSDLAHFIQSELHSNPGAFDDDFFRHLAEKLHSHLARPHERMIVSVYLIDHKPHKDYLICRGFYGDRQQKLKQQPFADPKTSSITLCTAETGRSHLLNFVEPHIRNTQCTETTIEITDDQFRGIRLLLRDRRFRIDSKKGWRSKRLTLTCRVGEVDWDTLLASREGRAFPDLFNKLRQRARIQFTDIFRDVGHHWPRPCSEVCFPILVARQVLGCINIECDSPDRFNATFLNVLMSYGAAVGTALIQQNNRRLLDSVQEVASAFHRTDHPVHDPVGLDRLARDIAGGLWCKRVDILGAGVRVDADFALLATSDQAGRTGKNWHTPRPNGNTRRLLARASQGVVGLVIDLERSSTLSTPVAVTYDLRVKGKRRTPYLRRRRAKDTDPVWLREDDADTTRLVAVLLRSSGDALNSAPTGVMWCAFRRRTFDSSSTRLYESKKREQYLQYLLTVAQRCSLVPIVCQSRFRTVIEREWDIRHSRSFEVHERIRHILTNPVESVDLRVMRATRLLIHLRDSLGTIEDLTQPQVLLDSRASTTAVSLDLIALLEESFELARDLVEAYATLRINGAEGIRVKASPEIAKTLLTQIFENNLRHAIWSFGTARVGQPVSIEIWCTRPDDSPDHVAVRIVDDGPGFKAGQVAADTGGGSPQFRLGEHGRGLDIIRRLSRAIGGQEATWGNADTHGAYSSFRFPLAGEE